MANAQLKAPLKEKEEKWVKEKAALAEMENYDLDRKYMFELADPNPEREIPVINMTTKRPIPHQKFRPYTNIVLTSQIIWEGQRRIVRYYDGCTTIFADEQSKDRETIDQFIRQTKRREFVNGKFGVDGDEKMLLFYLNICSWNAESHFRTKSANAVFRPIDTFKEARIAAEKIDKTEDALRLAREASVNKMMIHASYLGIPTVDWDSGNELTEKEIRASYRKEALNNPSEFINSFGNKSIEIKYFINKAFELGIISNSFNPNKLTWRESNNEICDISGLKSPDAICERAFEFSQLEDGQDFIVQLRSIFDNI